MATSDNVIKMKPFEGFNYPIEFVGNISDHLQAIRDMEVRSDDVFITSYPKSGTHWVYEVTYMLIHGKPDYCRSHIWLDVDTMEKTKNAPSPRILVTHIPTDRLPRQLLNGKGKIINMSRNPKDVAVSFYCFARGLAETSYGGDLNSYVRRFLEGDCIKVWFNTISYDSWFRSIKTWYDFAHTHSNVPLLYLNYEHMKTDLRSVILQIQQFLQVNADQDLIKEITLRCEFCNTQKDKMDNPDPKHRLISKGGREIFYRKGQVGDWKNWFTVSLNEEFDKVYKEKMKSIPLKFTFSL